MRTFVEVAKAGSFSAASRKLGLSATAVSRHVAELEQSLGVTLLRRTTRRVSTTDTGARYLLRASAILEEISRLNAETARREDAPQGTLRITAPPAIGHDWIVPIVVDFAESYPRISLELTLTERLVDLVAEGVDAAIRAGPLASSTLIAHRIIDVRYLLCASPDYLSRRGTPMRPEQVAEHDCIYWHTAAPGNSWTFTRNGRAKTVPVRFRLLLSDLAAQREAAARGLGLALLPLLSAREDLQSGRLRAVLPEYEIYSGVLSLVRPALHFEPVKLRLFIDFMTAALRDRAREAEPLAHRGGLE